jgi:GntR family transcriptional regulator
MRLAIADFDGKPLYEVVGETIRRRIVKKKYRPGTALPSEHQLGAELGVSQGTVRKALNDLVTERILFRRQGLGTFVSEQTEDRLRCLFFNIARDDDEAVSPLGKTVAFGEYHANAEEQQKLGLRSRDEVYRIKRLRFSGDEPILVERLSVARSKFPNLARDLPDYMYRLYQMEYGIMVSKTREQVKAIAAPRHEARLLNIEPGEPVLLIDRIALTIDRQPVEWRRSICKSDFYHFVCERS